MPQNSWPIVEMMSTSLTQLVSMALTNTAIDEPAP